MGGGRACRSDDQVKDLGFIGAFPIYQGFTDVNALLLGAHRLS